MSYTREQLETIENLHADFDEFLSQRKFTDARAVIDNLGDMGFEHEAFLLHQAYNRAYQDYEEELDMKKTKQERFNENQDLADRSYPRE